MACEKHHHLPQVTMVKFKNYCGELVLPCPTKVRWRDPSPFNVSNFVGPLTKCHIPSGPRNKEVNGG